MEKNLLTWRWWRLPYFQPASALSDHPQFQQAQAQTPEIVVRADVGNQFTQRFSKLNIAPSFYGWPDHDHCIASTDSYSKYLCLDTSCKSDNCQCMVKIVSWNNSECLESKSTCKYFSSWKDRLTQSPFLYHCKRDTWRRESEETQKERDYKSWQPLRLWTLLASTSITRAAGVHHTHVHVFRHLRQHM